MPSISSWIEQPSQLPRFGVETRDVWTFERITVRTRQRQIHLVVSAMMLSGDDVFDMQTEGQEFQWHMAILAPVTCALQEEFPLSLGHSLTKLVQLPSATSSAPERAARLKNRRELPS